MRLYGGNIANEKIKQQKINKISQQTIIMIIIFFMNFSRCEYTSIWAGFELPTLVALIE
jgi:hypothetical protein